MQLEYTRTCIHISHGESPIPAIIQVTQLLSKFINLSFPDQTYQKPHRNGLRQRQSIRHNRAQRNRPSRSTPTTQARSSPLPRRPKLANPLSSTTNNRNRLQFLHSVDNHHNGIRHQQRKRRTRLDRQHSLALRPTGRRSQHGRHDRQEPRH